MVMFVDLDRYMKWVCGEEMNCDGFRPKMAPKDPEREGREERRREERGGIEQISELKKMKSQIHLFQT